MKPRKNPDDNDSKLQSIFKREQSRGRFRSYHLTIDDLLEIEILENRKNLGKGELSSIAFAKRTNQAFLTDDQSARKLAASVMDSDFVQTTPQLFGWLFYTNLLGDSDKDLVISQHASFGRPLSPYFESTYLDAQELKLVRQS